MNEPQTAEPRPRETASPAVNPLSPLSQQIQIEATQVRLPATEFRRLAARWLDAKGAEEPTAENTSSATGFAILKDGDNFRKALQSLVDKNLAMIIAESGIVLLSGRSGYLVSGGESPIVTANGGSPSITYKAFGNVVKFVPTIVPNSRIQLKISPEISAINPKAGIALDGEESIPGFAIQSLEGTVILQSGQRVVISGFKAADDPKEEILFLITPHLVDPTATLAVREVRLDTQVINVNSERSRLLQVPWRTQTTNKETSPPSTAPPCTQRPPFQSPHPTERRRLR